MLDIDNNPFVNEEMLRIHKMIMQKRTGTHGQLAKKLGCCKRTAIAKINQIRTSGLPIEYSENLRSYYYPLEVLIRFTLHLDGEEISKIKGGVNKVLIEPSIPSYTFSNPLFYQIKLK